MAIISNQQEDQTKDDQNKPESTDPTPVSAPTTVTGPSQASASAAPASTGGQQAPTSSGRFNNLNNYLKANQNYNKDGGGLAGKIATNVTNQGQQIQQNVQQATNTFNTQANQQVQQAQQGQQLVQQAVVDPNAFIQNQDNVAALTAARDASYTGPKTLQDLTGNQNQAYLQDQAKQLQTTTDQAQTESGRFNVLKDMFKAPTYNRGQQTLDNLILQGNKDQLGALKNTQQVSQNVNQALNSGIDSTAALGTQAASQVQTARDTVRNTLNQNALDRDKALNDLAGTTQKNYDDKVGLTAADLKARKLSDLTKNLGINEGQATYNLDLSKYLQPNQTKATAQTVASVDDYSKIAALKQLIGGAYTEDSSKALDNYIDSSKANTFVNNVGFDQNSYQGDLTNTRANFANEYNTYVDALNHNPNDENGLSRDASITNSLNDLFSKYGVGGYKQFSRDGTQNGVDMNDMSTAYNAGNIFSANSNKSAAKTPYDPFANGLQPVNADPASLKEYDPELASRIAARDYHPETVICTELARQGYFSPETMEFDRQFGNEVRNSNPEVYYGYLELATPVVSMMQKSKLVTKAVHFIAKPWSNHMVGVIRDGKSGSFAGKLIHNIGSFFCKSWYNLNSMEKVGI